MISFPILPVAPDARCGFRTSTPFFIARAATSISGTKISPFLNLSPTTAIASIMLLRISVASQPSSRADCTAAPTSFAFPFSTNSATSVIFDIIKHLRFLFFIRIPHMRFIYFFTGPIRPSLYAPMYSIQ